jgi:hypothetical protein
LLKNAPIEPGSSRLLNKDRFLGIHPSRLVGRGRPESKLSNRWLRPPILMPQGNWRRCL